MFNWWTFLLLHWSYLSLRSSKQSVKQISHSWTFNKRKSKLIRKKYLILIEIKYLGKLSHKCIYSSGKRWLSYKSTFAFSNANFPHKINTPQPKTDWDVRLNILNILNIFNESRVVKFLKADLTYSKSSMAYRSFRHSVENILILCALAY